MDAGAIGEQLKEQSLALWNALNQKGILLPALFVFAWQATPSSDTAFFYFETNKLGFKPEFLGEVRLVGSIASLAGISIRSFEHHFSKVCSLGPTLACTLEGSIEH